VESSIYERFKSDLVSRTGQLTVSHPANEKTTIGAMVSGDHYRKVLSYLNEIGPVDASILCGGKPAIVEGYEQGFYIEPTVIEVQNNQCRLNQEEIFGPVVTLMPFDNEEELIAMANDVKYGLSATIWTKDLDRTMRLSKKIECGVVWINTWLMRDLRTPFGGTKDSGVGREGGLEALRFFTEPKNICIAFED
jgi:aminomuconate-semialdehyde/2-hydroxymuconate-6-semialdehyde dehydrogenase